MRQPVEQLEDYIDIGRFKRCGALRGGWIGVRPPHGCPHIRKMKAARFGVMVWLGDRYLPQNIKVDWVRLRYGYRPWMVCQCGRRVGRTYMSDNDYRCRRCVGAVYASLRKSRLQKMCFRASKVRLKLNGSARLNDPFPKKPPKMYRSTYARIRFKAELREAKISRKAKDRMPDYANLLVHVP
jgi:hypothetical protein